MDRIQTSSDAAKISRGLNALSATARNKLNEELTKIVSLYGGDRAQQALYFSAAQELFTELVGKYGEAAQAIAFEALEAQQIPVKSVQNIYQTMNVGKIISDAIQSPNAGMGYLNNAMDNAVKRGYRKTIMDNSDRWARVPSGSYTCPWCVMMASRGFVYRSKNTAMAQYHAYCDCAIIPAKDAKSAYLDGYDPDKLYKLYQNGEGIGKKPSNKPAFDVKGNAVNSVIQTNTGGQNNLNPVQTFAKNNANVQVENGMIIDSKTGKVIWDGSSGMAHAIDPPRHLLPGNAFAHNHPSGFTFSKDDIRNFVVDDLKTLYATSGNKIYELRAIGKVDPQMIRDYNSKVNYIKANNNIIERVKSGKITREEYNRRSSQLTVERLHEMTEKWLYENAEKYGVKYTVTEI